MLHGSSNPPEPTTQLLIRSWEAMDRLPPSNPQGHFGAALTAKLDPVFKAMAGP